mmetsp:Transcript_2399/g.3134  ORF Transcript_2399/g.3134 Transcript_2399/m.3134 type:complete len:347 (-) Transcript_2399:776-1816(-)
MDQSLLLGVATGALAIAAVAAMSTCEPKMTSSAHRHLLKLETGRTVAYYTFSEESQSRPILYLHGFPGSGMEPVPYGLSKNAPDQIVGMDRPGLGHTSQKDDDDNEKDPFYTCTSDIWALVEHLGWESFSVIGLSGGGPHAMALLASYLSSTELPKIEKIAFVGAICMSGGTEGMMAANQASSKMVENYKISLMTRLLLRLVYTAISIVLRILPDQVMHFILKSNKDIPKVDQKVVARNVEGITELFRVSLRQGAPGLLADLRRCFGTHAEVENIVRYHYADESKDDLPEIYIHHGKMDVNVPFCHGQHMHENIFHKKSKLISFEHHGHFPLIAEESETYVKSVMI